MTARRARFSVLAALIVAVALVAVACSQGEPAPTGGPIDFLGIGEPPPMPILNPNQVELGRERYGTHCASCHGVDLSGHPDWKTPEPDGSYRPPPHDSSGHTWHHPDSLLIEIIRDGGGFEGSKMPGFGEVLSDEEITSILSYLKSEWTLEERGHQWRMTWQDRQFNGG
jgi:mono/diheme cytochrome c family protein